MKSEKQKVNANLSPNELLLASIEDFFKSGLQRSYHYVTSFPSEVDSSTYYLVEVRTKEDVFTGLYDMYYIDSNRKSSLLMNKARLNEICAALGFGIGLLKSLQNGC